MQSCDRTFAIQTAKLFGIKFNWLKICFKMFKNHRIFVHSFKFKFKIASFYLRKGGPVNLWLPFARTYSRKSLAPVTQDEAKLSKRNCPSEIGEVQNSIPLFKLFHCSSTGKGLISGGYIPLLLQQLTKRIAKIVGKL